MEGLDTDLYTMFATALIALIALIELLDVPGSWARKRKKKGITKKQRVYIEFI